MIIDNFPLPYPLDYFGLKVLHMQTLVYTHTCYKQSPHKQIECFEMFYAYEMVFASGFCILYSSKYHMLAAGSWYSFP